MSRNQGTIVQNSFIQGLITEATSLKFPENAATETLNCVFDETGRVTRRVGLDFEDGYSFRTQTKITTDAFTEFLWQSVAGLGDTSFVVQQQGRFLHFYDASESNVLSDNYIGALDLNVFIPIGSSKNPAIELCQFAFGRGILLVTNPAIDPIKVEYDTILDEILGTTIEVQIRDFEGVEDGLGESERPSDTVAGIKTSNPEHYYNLLNQSWFIGDALAQWDTARTDLPSNRDYVGLYRNSETDAFDNNLVTSFTPGTRPASKGHFILKTWSRNRTQAMIDEGFTGANIGVTTTEISPGTGLVLGDFSNMSFAFDNNSSTGASKLAAVEGYIGKSFSSPFRIVKAEIDGFSTGFIIGGNPSVTLQLFGKQGSAPLTSTNGTLLGTTGPFVDSSLEQTISSSDTDTFWDHVWIGVSHNGAADDIVVSEVELFSIATSTAEFVTTERPACVEFFAGRAWYAAINDRMLASDIYFSQIVLNNDQFGKCYQQNDPASEDFTDLLPDDGGVIVIPEIARVRRLFAYQSGLLVFATNGVWIITGGSQGGFLATDFAVKRLSNEGTNSPLSFLSYKGLPSWWGENGIYSITFDANYQSFTVTSLSDEKIKTFFLSVPEINRQFVKGVFDLNNSVGYWLYNSDTNLAEADYYRYDSVLGVNGLSGAFYPWMTNVKPERDGPEVRGAVYVINPQSLFAPTVKIITTVDAVTNEDLSFAEFNSLTYKDWSGYAVDETDPTLEQDYDSDAVTAYRLDGQAIRFFQGNYIIVYTEDDGLENSCFVQGIFDFTTSPNSGKWSMPQQCFNSSLTNRSTNYRRLKIRGRGRSMQLRFTSESGKPFTLIGWSLWESANAQV